MNIELEAQKISNKYNDNGIDMNQSIAKVASENNFNIEQTKRLVEECNKTCYLTKFAATGEQTFDIADYQKVKEILQKDGQVEKTASYEFKSIEYKSNGNGGSYGISVSDDMEKTASENDLLNQAIDRCQNEINSSMTKIAELKHRFAPLEKIEELEKKTEEYRLVKNHLIEKRAGLTSGLLNAGGAVTSTIIKHPIKAGLMPLGLIGSFKQGAKKSVKDTSAMIGNTVVNLEKQASTVGEIFQEAKPLAMAMGLIGVAGAVAKGAGGLASRMMQQRKLNESFQTIEQNNEDIRQIPNARSYFDVVARHSPDLALDPMVAPQLIRQFDMFGGVDINTVGKLREIQKSNYQNKDNDIAGNFISGMGTLKSIAKRHS